MGLITPKERTGLAAATCLWVCRSLLALLVAYGHLGGVRGQEAPGDTTAELERQGYLVEVDLPLVGDRDQVVKRQIQSIANAESASRQRNVVVVLKFQARPLTQAGADPRDLSGGLGTRGSEFSRCLELARFLTSAEAARVRLIAYLPQSVEGHAVLPVLACEEIIAAAGAELGRAAVDEPADAIIESAYRDIARRRATLPEAAVVAMLDAREEVYSLQLADETRVIAGRAEAEQLRRDGQVLREEVLWPGGAQATFSGEQLKRQRWINRTADSEAEVVEVLGLNGSLRTVKQLPRDWKAVTVTISGSLTNSRVNQIIRGINEQIDAQQVNLLVVRVQPTEANFSQASRLANFIADLDADQVYSLGIVEQPLAGPLALIPVACREAVLVAGAQLEPASSRGKPLADDDAAQRFLGDMAARTARPLALLSVLLDSDVRVQEFINQKSGKRSIFANWQVARQADSDQWLPKRTVAGGEPINPEIALTYRLVDSLDDTPDIALARLGLESAPPEMKTSWLDSSIQMLLSQGWLPRLLLTIGFFALMAELGNPGIGAGGFLSCICFLGFFWIEGLNGNVEALEVILFVAGLIALALELFVVPGFGIFGIGGLLMLFVSVVLASQTFIWPTTSAQLSEVSVNLFWTACLALCGMIGLLFMHKQLERLPMFRWVTLQPTEDQEDLEYRESVVRREHLLHQQGLTTTRLNPSGKAQFGNEIVQVVGTGTMIEEGTPVRVVEVRGNLILVEQILT